MGGNAESREQTNSGKTHDNGRQDRVEFRCDYQVEVAYVVNLRDLNFTRICVFSTAFRQSPCFTRRPWRYVPPAVSSLIGTRKLLAKIRKFRTDRFRSPRSTEPIKVRCSPLRSANCCCVSLRSSRIFRIRWPSFRKKLISSRSIVDGYDPRCDDVFAHHSCKQCGGSPWLRMCMWGSLCSGSGRENWRRRYEMAPNM